MQVRNNYELDVFNGDLGQVEAISFGDRELAVRFDDRLVMIPPDDLDDIVPAYACTIHKSQGSEYPAVVIVLHHQHRIAKIPQPLESFEQPPVIPLMKTDGRLVKDVKDPHELRADLGGDQQRRAERRATGDAERERRGEWVSEQCLKRHSAERKHCPGHEGAQHARNANVQQNFALLPHGGEGDEFHAE